MATSQPKMTAEHLLSLLLDNAHMLDAAGPDGDRHLVVTVSPWLLDELAAYGADDREDNGDAEPNVVAPDDAGRHVSRATYDQPVDYELTTVREWRGW